MGQRLPLYAALDRDPSWVLAAVLQAGVCVFESERADVDAFEELTARLGAYIAHPLTKFRVRERLLTISNLVLDGSPQGVHEGGAYWHTDMSYREQNTVLTALCCINAMAVGGETSFVDCVAAWQLVQRAIEAGAFDFGISTEQLRSLRVLHKFGNREVHRSPRANQQALCERESASLDAMVKHALVQVHPRTSQEFIYAVAGSSFLIEGWSVAESTRLLDALFDYVLQSAPRYDHLYRPGDVVIWDNLSTLHSGPDIPATCDPAFARVLYRTSILYDP